MSDQEESKRVSLQVSSLSTQLIESVEKQSKLEDQLIHARRTIASFQKTQTEYEQLKNQLQEATSTIEKQTREVAQAQSEMETERKLRTAAEEEVSALRQEVEDLTASLFEEANKLVAQANISSHNVEEKNKRLIGVLREHETRIESQEIQIKNLKTVLYSLEEQKATDSPRDSTISLPLNDPHVFTPVVQELRYDLPLYTEFLKFIAVLPYCTTIRETSQTSRLLKRLCTDEIQPLLRLDSAQGVGWMSRRSLLSLMIDGKVVVEPISGINENYKMGRFSSVHSQAADNMYSYPSDSPPVAVQDDCALCGETRNDVIEHARMYMLKTPTENFPLCHYCLLKVRQSCEIFAFLRSIKAGAWCLEKVTMTDILTGKVFNGTAMDKKTKRMSLSRIDLTPQMSQGEFQTPPGMPGTNVHRAWAHLCKLRSQLHWAHVGVWSFDDAISLDIKPVSNSRANSDMPYVETPMTETAMDDSDITSYVGEKEVSDGFDFESYPELDKKRSDEIEDQIIEKKSTDELEAVGDDTEVEVSVAKESDEVEEANQNDVEESIGVNAQATVASTPEVTTASTPEDTVHSTADSSIEFHDEARELAQHSDEHVSNTPAELSSVTAETTESTSTLDPRAQSSRTASVASQESFHDAEES